MKPYAGNDYDLEAMRAADWTRNLAAWTKVSRGVVTDPAALEGAAGIALEHLFELAKAEIFHVLEGPSFFVADEHGDYFTAGWSVVMAEARGIARRHPPEIFPRLVPFPRLADLEQSTRRAATVARERLRAVRRAIRGEEADPWT